MQFRDLRAQYAALKTEMDAAILGAVAAGDYISGKKVTELENELAAYAGAGHCISCANGTDALSMVMMAWGIGPGDAVFVPDFTFFATGEVVSHCGAEPIFVDVDADTFNIDPDALERQIIATASEGRLSPRAVIPVDLFGLPADYPRIEAVARKYGLLILEDSAQGFGGSINGKRAGSFGDAATTSFFPAKPLGCYGDGGAIFTNDDGLAALLRSIRVHGKGEDKYDNVRIGLNSRLDTLQAAVLLVKFHAFCEYELDSVNRIAGQYTELLSSCVKTPSTPKSFLSSWAQYTIILKNSEEREAVRKHLSDEGIPSMIYYPKPMHNQTAFSKYANNGNFSVTNRLCERVLSLPMHPYLTEDDISNITAVIVSALGGV